MATISAITHNPLIKPFYKKLKNKGKTSKVAIIAGARKLLLVLASIAQRGTPWVPVIEKI